MTGRIRLGVKGSSEGLWVSKPGFDVSIANPGDMLFDSDAQAYQVIASGSQHIADAWTSGTSSETTLTVSTALGIGSYSNVALWFDLSIQVMFNDGSFPDSNYIRTIRETANCRGRITSGTLYITCTVYYYNDSEFQPRMTSNWFAFRSQYA